MVYRTATFAIEERLMRKSWLVVTCLAAWLLAGGPAVAQSPPPEAMDAARELVTTVNAADQFKALLPLIVRNLKPAIVQNRPEVEHDYDIIMPILMAGMNARVDEIVEQIAAIYARNFTADEMREVTAFYRGPTGQKFLEKQPVILQDSMAIGQKFGQSIAIEMQNRIVEELRKRGHKI
jgi:uncharacterized protein